MKPNKTEIIILRTQASLLGILKTGHYSWDFLELCAQAKRAYCCEEAFSIGLILALIALCFKFQVEPIQGSLWRGNSCRSLEFKPQILYGSL